MSAVSGSCRAKIRHWMLRTRTAVASLGEVLPDNVFTAVSVA
jgi:hypothetical protein